MDKKRPAIDFSDLNEWYNEKLKELKEEAMILERKRKQAQLARKRHRAFLRKERKRRRERLEKTPHAMVRRSQVAEVVQREGIAEGVTNAVRFHMNSVYGVSKCETCGLIKETKFFSLQSTKTHGLRSVNKSCIKCTAMAGYDKDPLVWFSKYIVSESRSRALASGNTFTIDWQWVRDRFNSLEGKCELCDRKMTTFKRDYRSPQTKSFMNHPLNLSLDQRVAGAGYTEENVQLVNLQCNLAKLDTSQEDFVEMCKAVATKFSN